MLAGCCAGRRPDEHVLARRLNWMFLSWMFGDARHALGGLRRSPAFTSIAIISLALGIGANTAVFSFVNAILLKQLPVFEPQRLVAFAAVIFPLRVVDEIARRDTALSGMFGWLARPVSLSTGETARWVNGELVTGQYFRTLEVRPAIGRLLNEDDVRDAPANPVCVLSYGLWQRAFSGDAGVVGRNVFLNGRAYRVLGVSASGFYGAESGRRFDVAVPATRIGDFMPIFSGASGLKRLKKMSWLFAMGRLAPAISRSEAQQRTQLLLRQIDPAKETELRFDDGSQGFNAMRAGFGRPLLVLMGVVALVLLAACANLANLLLARAQARAREFAVRLSLGASRARLVGQLLVESSVLAIAGGVAGVALSFWIDSALEVFLNTGRSAATAVHVTPDVRVLAFSILLTFATAILIGLAPSWQATRPDLVAGMKLETAASGPATGALLRRTLVVIQIALSLAIVFGAALLTRTLRTLATVDLGFQADRVIALNADPAANGHSGTEVSSIFDEILKRARDLPGVKAASLATSTPNGSIAISMDIDVPGYAPKPAPGDDAVHFNFVSPYYFETLGQSLLGGRDFDRGDTRGSAPVDIVNQKFVRHYFGGRNPVGRIFQQGREDVAIVGVAADSRDYGVRNGPIDVVYRPVKQGPISAFTLLVRADDDPRRTVPALLEIVQSIDRRIPVSQVHTLDQEVDAGLSSERILGYLSTLFAALATLLAGIGLYGVLAYSIARRTREIGIRLAVGAQRREIAGLFARESFALLLNGLILGAPLALVSARALGSLLFGVGASDPLTLLGSVVVLVLAAVVATSIPVWRAARVDPIVTLRWE